MQYQKLVSGDTVIEFHNNWLGEETVIIQGQIVSKKSSIMGIDHSFTVQEAGQPVRYVLTSKVDGQLQVFLDLRRNGELVIENMPLPYGTFSRPGNAAKKKGLAHLNKYEITKAIQSLTEALDKDAKDPEIYFHLACAYSIEEKPLLAFENLRLAIANKLHHTESILNHDMLAYVRMHEAFEGFLGSNFSQYDSKLIEAENRS